jgi:hypothetical protein
VGDKLMGLREKRRNAKRVRRAAAAEEQRWRAAVAASRQTIFLGSFPVFDGPFNPSLWLTLPALAAAFGDRRHTTIEVGPR